MHVCVWISVMREGREGRDNVGFYKQVSYVLNALEDLSEFLQKSKFCQISRRHIEQILSHLPVPSTICQTLDKTH